jgi:hypothetical protein
MTKVVYNACYGGFSLSVSAVKRAREISGDPKWGDATLPGEMFDDGSGPAKDHGRGDKAAVHLGYDFPRTDPVLVQVVEEMGEDASSDLSHLKIQTVPDGTRYRIDEYDGFERVMTIDDYEWQTA